MTDQTIDEYVEDDWEIDEEPLFSLESCQMILPEGFDANACSISISTSVDGEEVDSWDFMADDNGSTAVTYGDSITFIL